MPDSKARYSQFCQEGYVPIHFQPWWLDAVCGETALNVEKITLGFKNTLRSDLKKAESAVSPIILKRLKNYSLPWQNETNSQFFDI